MVLKDPMQDYINRQKRRRVASAIAASVREVLTIALVTLVVLKATDTITWSWLWALTPLWVPAVIIVVLVVAYLALTPFEILERRRRIKRRDSKCDLRRDP